MPFIIILTIIFVFQIKNALFACLIFTKILVIRAFCDGRRRYGVPAPFSK